MDDDFADTLIGPLVTELEAMVKAGGDGAKIWADGGPNPIHITLDDYWMSEGMLVLAEDKLAELLSMHPLIKRFVFGVPLSFDDLEPTMVIAPPGALPHHMLWLLCVELDGGYDVCALFYTIGDDGQPVFEEDITMLEGEHQLEDGAPGFRMLKGWMANVS